MSYAEKLIKVSFIPETSMIKTILYFSCLCIMSLALHSCSNTPTDSPKPNQLSDNRIEGKVFLFDSFAHLVSDLSGVVVTVTSTSGVKYLDTTAVNGSYLIEDLPAGYYTITASHPDYAGPPTSYAFNKSLNFPYVGAGVLNISDLSLAAPMSSAIISNLTAQVVWGYVTEHDLHTGKTDTTDTLAGLIVNFDFAHTGNKTKPRLTLAESQDGDCDQSVVSRSWVTKVEKSSVSHKVRMGNFFKDLRNRYGPDVYTKQFYVQVRPEYVIKKEDGSEALVAVCLDPVSIPIRFTKP